jgi:hypothetical protein
LAKVIVLTRRPTARKIGLQAANDIPIALSTLLGFAFKNVCSRTYHDFF